MDEIGREEKEGQEKRENGQTRRFRSGLRNKRREGMKEDKQRIKEKRYVWEIWRHGRRGKGGNGNTRENRDMGEKGENGGNGDI